MIFRKKKADSQKKEVPKELPQLAVNLLRSRKPVQMAEQPKLELRQPAVQPPVAAGVPEMLPKAESKSNFERIGFFMNLLKGVNNRPKEVEEAEKMYNDAILAKDLLGEMKAFWNEKKKHIIFTAEERKLKEKLLERIETLQKLETEWQDFHLGLIEREEGIRKNESELKSMLGDFKSICARHISAQKKMERIQAGLNVLSPEKYFRLCNGEVLKDIPSLVAALKEADESVFTSHVNDSKNDFANWVNDVFEDAETAEELISASTREEAIAILEKNYA
ncbi:MAG: hypothetical protein ABIB71_08235 [Candidatus Woesearchaeota archaeon]